MKRTCITLALLVSLGACEDDEDAAQTDGGAGSMTYAADASTAPGADAGAAPETDAQPGSGQLIPLIVWVDDLVDHHTNESATPDTVEDKRIMETEDPRLFDKYFE